MYLRLIGYSAGGFTVALNDNSLCAQLQNPGSCCRSHFRGGCPVRFCLKGISAHRARCASILNPVLDEESLPRGLPRSFLFERYFSSSRSLRVAAFDVYPLTFALKIMALTHREQTGLSPHLVAIYRLLTGNLLRFIVFLSADPGTDHRCSA